MSEIYLVYYWVDGNERRLIGVAEDEKQLEAIRDKIINYFEISQEQAQNDIRVELWNTGKSYI